MPSGAAAEQEGCATRFSTVARRAYRRPLTDGDVQTLLRFCRGGIVRGFDACIQQGIERILASPYFLFRVEGGVPAMVSKPAAGKPVAQVESGGPVVQTVAFRPGAADTDKPLSAAKPERLSDIDMASRLSFFLWSSIPDDTLLDLAEKGKLKDQTVVAQQVKRMLADPRSRALVDNFAGQWLELRRLDSAAPVEGVFPDFDGELRLAFKEETERLIDSMIARTGRSAIC